MRTVSTIAVFALVAGNACAQGFPNRPLRIVVVADIDKYKKLAQRINLKIG